MTSFCISTWERYFLDVHNGCIESINHVNPSAVHKRLKQRSFIHSWFSNNPNRNILSKKQTVATDTHTHISVFITTCFFHEDIRHTKKQINTFSFLNGQHMSLPVATYCCCALTHLHVHSYLHKIGSVGFQSCPFL